VEWLGPGRRVTAKGNLGVADAKELVAVLGTGDRVDSSYGREVRTRTADDLPGVSLLVRLAEAADVVRREGSRLVPGPTADQMAEDPLGAWYAVVAAAFRVPLRVGVRLEYDDTAREGLPFALAVAEGRHGRAAVAELADLLRWRTRQHWPVAHREELFHDRRRDGVDIWFWRRLRPLERAGAVELGEWHEVPYVELTPLGSLGLRVMLTLAGLPAPATGALAGQSAEGLAARALDLDDPELVEEELRRWVAARGDAGAAGELVAALLDEAAADRGGRTDGTCCSQPCSTSGSRARPRWGSWRRCRSCGRTRGSGRSTAGSPRRRRCRRRTGRWRWWTCSPCRSPPAVRVRWSPSLSRGVRRTRALGWSGSCGARTGRTSCPCWRRWRRPGRSRWRRRPGRRCSRRGAGEPWLWEGRRRAAGSLAW
jgi:hypothetical protein